MRTVFLSLILVGSVAFLATPATAEEVCTTDNIACVTEVVRGDGDPECSEPGSDHEGMDRVQVNVPVRNWHLGAEAHGGEMCYHSASDGAIYGYERVAARAALCNYYGCQSVGFDWSTYSNFYGEGCYMKLSWRTSVAGFGGVSIDDPSGDGGTCPAGGPPNPGWGSLLP